MTTAYRADQVGSLLRPEELLEARYRGAPQEELRSLEDRHILRLLDRQRELGVDVFTDGELRRRNFMSDLMDSVEGFDFGEALPRSWKGEGKAPPASVTGVVVSRLRQVRRLTEHEVSFLRAHSPGPFKITLPSANQFPAIAFKKGLTDRVYRDHSELLWDIVPIVRREVEALVAEGVPYVQIDAPRYSYYIDPRWRQYVREEMGVEPEAALDEAIRADNACLEGLRGRGTVLAIHLCRGNNRSQWYAEGGYDPIAEKLFHQLQVDRFLLEYDDERSGTFEPLRFVPPDKTVVLGLVSTKRPEVESQETLLRRIEEASRYVPLDRLALSPQCGFASVMEGNLLSEDDQWAKLRLVVETARRVWG
ncbi:MAG: cobalamin-independent methionine synthase II family protein [Armatimonadota bacterium]|nr:cobalamin-independent methionine synthase II family protein [Armatimonadota bacterium]MDR5676484.1 cobalamin-independent methionine synthase II family protein [Armatimonadota bacterium]MDR7388040.1 cobalamin-independent methionine synthase II family protein [Armatimonadota bacterium]MDR7391478.1 cobalamin-independent methionine synthase II family protein [Armatimonadota bacterium]MDR7395237.1 cobalamin-independent methionine synthase II family protein [Armatimonadota bacterium]